MTFRRELAHTFAWQGFGAAAVFVAVAAVGMSDGSAAQGVFSRTKSELEFVAAFAALGMPQAAFYFLRLNRLSERAVLRLSASLGLFAGISSFTYAYCTHDLGVGFCLVFALASAGSVAHGMLRIMVLHDLPTRWFNIVTMVPQILMLLFVLVLIAARMIAPGPISAMFALAYVLSIVAPIWYFLRSSARNGAELKIISPVRSGELFVYGASAWLTAAISAAATVFWLRIIERDLGLARVGEFSMGLVLAQFVLTPFVYAAPLLFRRWAGSGATVRAVRPALLCGIVTAACLAVGLTVLSYLPPRFIPAQYAELYTAAWVFAVSASVDVVVRVAAVAANAMGAPFAATLAEAARFVALGIGALTIGTHQLIWAAACWALAAVAACLVLLGSTMRRA